MQILCPVPESHVLQFERLVAARNAAKQALAVLEEAIVLGVGMPWQQYQGFAWQDGAPLLVFDVPDEPAINAPPAEATEDAPAERELAVA